MNIAVRTIDDIKGRLDVDSSIVHGGHQRTFCAAIDVQADSLEGERRFLVNSSLLYASLAGDFKLVPLVNNLLYNATSAASCSSS